MTVQPFTRPVPARVKPMMSRQGMDQSRPDTSSSTKDERHISSDWELLGERIDGVRLREVRHVVTGNGQTTELFRQDWGVATGEVAQIIHVTLHPGAISAWHMHRQKTDHL